MAEREVKNRSDFREDKDSRANTLLAPSEPEVEPPKTHPDDKEDVRERPGGAKRGRWRWLIYLILLALIGIGAWRFTARQGSNQTRAPSEIQTVGAAKVVVGDIDDMLTGLGTVTPLATVTVQTQINGQLHSVGFKEGQIVQKGDFLAADRSAALSGGARPGGRHARPRPGPARPSPIRPAALRDARAQDSIAQQQVADQRVPRPAGQGHGQAGPGRGRDRQAQPRLLPHRRSGHRPRRPAPGRPRQLRPDHRTPPASSCSRSCSRSR